MLVEYPPPPAHVEAVPVDPGKPCVWVDGHYEWLGRRWQWQPGDWYIVAEGCHRAGPRLAWAPEGGALYYTPPAFYTETGRKCADPKQCSSQTVKK